MDSNFKVGDLVWARMKSYPPWPARIAKSETQKKRQVYVYFFGSKPSYGWVASSSITAFDSCKEDLSNASQKPDFKEALKQIEEYKAGGIVVLKDSGMTSTDDDKDQVETESDKGDAEENGSTDAEPQKRKRQPKRKFSIESGEISTPASKTKGRKRVSDVVENGPKKSKVSTSMRNNKSPIPDIIDTPDAPEMDLANVSALLKSKSIEPSSCKFGFIGLGIMGTGMVNNLINSRHKVNLWSRNDDKCKAIKEQADSIDKDLVKFFVAPCDVMENSDIVFSCLSDPEAAESIVFGNCNVLQQNKDTLDGKGFVEMTGIDPKTSLKLAEAIKSKGGRYLEAQLQGSREEANEGSLVILTAGDEDLFADCQSCFKAMGKTSLYLGEVGVATKVYLILQLMRGIALVGLSEGLVLADRCGISGKDIINIFNMTNMSSSYLRNKANLIVNKDFKKVEQSIKNMQKDIRLALGLSDDLMQPMMMASAANEVYKHSRKLGYDEHDCACIYMKARY